MTGIFHIVLAMKPVDGGFAENALKHGVAGVSIDGCRIGLNGEKPPSGSAKRVYASNQYTEQKVYGNNTTTSLLGRFPANIIHDGSEMILAEFAKTGESKSSGGRVGNISKTSMIYGGGKGLGQDIAPEDVRGDPGFGDTGTPDRFFKRVDELPDPEE